jgi:hypothetical protein
MPPLNGLGAFGESLSNFDWFQIFLCFLCFSIHFNVINAVILFIRKPKAHTITQHMMDPPTVSTMSSSVPPMVTSGQTLHFPPEKEDFTEMGHTTTTNSRMFHVFPTFSQLKQCRTNSSGKNSLKNF